MQRILGSENSIQILHPPFRYSLGGPLLHIPPLRLQWESSYAKVRDSVLLLLDRQPQRRNTQLISWHREETVLALLGDTTRQES
jgi:hypothetical protein